MTHDEESQRVRLRRLSRAVDLHVQRQNDGSPEADDEFLERHADLRDLLEPMIAATSTGSLASSLDRDDETRATPSPASAMTSRQRLLIVGMSVTTLVAFVVASLSFVLARRANDRLTEARDDVRRRVADVARLERESRDGDDETRALRHERELALVAQGRAALERDAAIKRATREGAIAEFARQWLTRLEPGEASPSVTIERVLDEATKGIDSFVAGAPDAEAGVRTLAGMAYLRIGAWSAAALHLEKARTLSRMQLGAESRESFDATSGLADADRALGKWPEAERLYRELLAAEGRELGETHASTLDTATRLASLLVDRMKFDEAEHRLRDTLESARAGLGDEDPITLRAAEALGDLMRRRERFEEAENVLRHALDVERRSLGATHARTVATMRLLSAALRDEGRLDDADKLAREALDADRSSRSDDLGSALATRALLASIDSKRGRHADAEAEWRSILGAWRSRHGDDSLESLRATRGLVATLGDSGRAAEAEALARSALATAGRVFGKESPITFEIAGDLASLVEDRRGTEAEALRRTAADGWGRSVGDEHPRTLEARAALAAVLVRQSRWEEAESIRRSVWTIRVRIEGDAHPRTLRSAIDLAEALEGAGHMKEAEEALRSVVDLGRHTVSSGTPGDAGNDSVVYQRLLGTFFTRRVRFEEAQAVLIDALASSRTTLGLDPKPVECARVKEALVALYEAWGKPDLAGRMRSNDDAVAAPREGH